MSLFESIGFFKLENVVVTDDDDDQRRVDDSESIADELPSTSFALDKNDAKKPYGDDDDCQSSSDIAATPQSIRGQDTGQRNEEEEIKIHSDGGEEAATIALVPLKEHPKYAKYFKMLKMVFYLLYFVLLFLLLQKITRISNLSCQ